MNYIYSSFVVVVVLAKCADPVYSILSRLRLCLWIPAPWEDVLLPHMAPVDSQREGRPLGSRSQPWQTVVDSCLRVNSPFPPPFL